MRRGMNARMMTDDHPVAGMGNGKAGGHGPSPLEAPCVRARPRRIAFHWTPGRVGQVGKK